jgi:isopentenyl phosphate kinase
LHDLNHQLKQLSRRNRDGSHATQRDWERLLSLVADQLHALGFRGMSIRPSKPKQVDTLIKRWRREEAIKFSPS